MPRRPNHSGSQRISAERSLIQQIRARQSNKSFAGMELGIGDDGALLSQKREEQIVVTTDLSIQNRHFLLDWHPAEAVGHRTLARGLSDLAAMGARPLAAFLSLGLTPELTRSKGRKPTWLDRFLDGFFALAQAHKTPLAGGDLAQSALAVADIVLVGAVPKGRALLRSGAKAGDKIYVTGSLGGSASALEKLRKRAQTGSATFPKTMRGVLAPHFYPEPRLAQGLWLQQRRAASAAIDLSDGLSTDLTHVCEESRLSAEIDTALLPVAAGATLSQALHGGEDYELLFTAPPDRRIPLQIAGVAITQIGRMIPRHGQQAPISLKTGRGSQPLAAQGWEHFDGSSGKATRR